MKNWGASQRAGWVGRFVRLSVSMYGYLGVGIVSCVLNALEEKGLLVCSGVTEQL